jgi:hypothetical protein
VLIPLGAETPQRGETHEGLGNLLQGLPTQKLPLAVFLPGPICLPCRIPNDPGSERKPKGYYWPTSPLKTLMEQQTSPWHPMQSPDGKLHICKCASDHFLRFETPDQQTRRRVVDACGCRDFPKNRAHLHHANSAARCLLHQKWLEENGRLSHLVSSIS